MSGRTIQVRRARQGDLGAVLEIEGASFADPWTLDAFEAALTLPHFRFAVAESLGHLADSPAQPVGKIIGYITIVSMAPEAEVANIAVAPTERGGGVGDALLRHGLDGAASEAVKTVYLEVRESNGAARRLYERHGFEVVGRRRGYYDKPREDALILRRDFDDS